MAEQSQTEREVVTTDIYTELYLWNKNIDSLIRLCSTSNYSALVQAAQDAEARFQQLVPVNAP